MPENHALHVARCTTHEKGGTLWRRTSDRGVSPCSEVSRSAASPFRVGCRSPAPPHPRVEEAGGGRRYPPVSKQAGPARASRMVRQRLATNRVGATRTPTTRVGQPSAVMGEREPRGRPAGCQAAERSRPGRGDLGGELQPASKCPTTARDAPPPGIQRRGRAPPRDATRRAPERSSPLARACTTSAARSRHAEATARLAGVSGCGTARALRARPPQRRARRSRGSGRARAARGRRSAGGASATGFERAIFVPP